MLLASRGKVCELEDKLKQLCVEMESSKSRERTLKSDLDGWYIIVVLQIER